MMKFKSYEAFEQDYKKYRYVDKVSSRYYPQHSLNEKELKSYYEQYVKKWHATSIKIKKTVKSTTSAKIQKDQKKEKSKDMLLYETVIRRDKTCRLLAILTPLEREIWKRHQNRLGHILDGAHVFGKGAYPWMRYEAKNIVLLNRFSHSCLDTGKSPIDGHQISFEEKEAWWQRIVGVEEWYFLERLACRA